MEYTGSLLAIPAEGVAVLAKVIFASEYFADVIAIKLYASIFAETGSSRPDDEAQYRIYYTNGASIRSKRWEIVGRIEVTDRERHETERTAAGELWIEDRHLGKASDFQLENLPKMLVHGPKLIEKYAARLVP